MGYRLARLEASNWLSFERLDLNFSGVDQLALVGPVGSGKSALLDGLRFALWGEARGITNRLERLMRSEPGVTSMWVRASLVDDDGHELVVRRERDVSTKAGASSLTVTLDGEDVGRHTIGETEAWLRTIVGDHDGSLVGPLMAQGESAGLMAMDPGPRKELLFRLRGLTRFDVPAAIAQKIVSDCTLQLAVLHGERDRLEPQRLTAEQIATCREDRDRLIARKAELEAEIGELDERVTVLREEAAALIERGKREDELDRRLVAANRRLDEAHAEADRLRREKGDHERQLAEPAPAPVHEELARIDAELMVATNAGVEWERGQMELGRLRDEVTRAKRASLVATTVPCGAQGEFAACRFLVDAVAADASVPGLIERGQALAARLGPKPDQTRLEDLRSQRTALLTADAEVIRGEERRARAREALEAFGGAWERANERTREAGEEIKEIEAERLRIQQDVGRRDELTTELNRITEERRGLAGMLDEISPRIIELAAAITAAEGVEARWAEIEAETAPLADRREIHQVLGQAFGRDGIPTALFEATVEELEVEANAILDRMPGGYRVQLRTHEETKASTVREQLGITVLVGDRERDYPFMSGGQRLTIDVAVRAAVAELTDGLDMFWLDEPAGMLDEPYREGLVDVAAALRDRFGLVVVATHQLDLADRFPAIARTRIAEGASTVEVD